MSTRLARNVAASVARRSSNVASSSARVGRRNMSAASHAAETAKKSDKPWIIGATLVFGPAFLYLVSPSARKNRHDFHDDKHDYPGYTPKDHAAPAAEPVVVKDDEGTPANVSSSIKLAEQEDVPQDSTTPTEESKTRDAAATESSGDSEPSASGANVSEVKSDVQEKELGNKAGTFNAGEEGPTDQGAPRVAGTEGITPKEKTEGKHESKEKVENVKPN
ncbi:hypothetical protein BDQ12DRAFT_680212 [Crucibulum laeve]|uniref:Uncharacterized protein n=1 Tax=Crucibulum laeve TaxID=68775 RepID=A0A5C3M8X5_9AGAR|nr:hypothetical protein BDQ12DRAFT_680212 [Crucibulum laeve]